MMKKKLTCLAAILIILSTLLCSCVSDMFGEFGVTMAPEASTNLINNQTEPESTSESTSSEPVYGSRPSYEGLNLADYIKVDYKSLTLTVDMLPPEITDQVVEANLSGLIDYYVTNYSFDCKRTLVTEGTVAEWDFVEIGFVGKLDGVAFEGGTSTSNVGMIVNEHDSGYIPGFAAGIIGAQYGTTVEVPVTFPEDYRATELAGKDVIFEITVYGKRVYEVTDAVIESLTGEYKTVDEFKKYLKEEYIPDLYESNLLDKVSGQIIEELANIATVYSYPTEQFLYYYNSNVSYMTKMAETLGLSYEEYMTATGETDDVLRQKAEESVKTDMAIYYVLEAEGKAYTDNEYNEALDYYVNYYNSYGYNYDRTTIEALFEMDYYPGYLRYQFNRERVISLMFEYANIVEKAD